MTRLKHQLLSLFVILAMVVTLLPMGAVQAAASGNEYFKFTNFSTDQNDPTQVNKNLVDLTGTFNSVSPTSLSYQVEQLVNGQVVSSTKGVGVRPIIKNANTFTFASVPLFQGLNRLTVMGTNSAGNQVEGECFAFFSNVPVLYDIKLLDGSSSRPLEAGTPLYVDSATALIMLKAPNADSVSINGKLGLNSGGDTFYVSDIPLQAGLNDLAIVASNKTMTYSLTRQVVYYNGFPTGFNTSVNDAAGTPKSVSLDRTPTVGPNDAAGTALNGTIHGSVVYKYNAALPTTTKPSLTLELYNNTTGALVQSFTTNVSAGVSDGKHTTFTYDTNETLNINTNGQYTLRVKGVYDTTDANFPVGFSYRNANTAYITDLNQLYNVRIDTTTGKAVSDSSTVFPQNSMIFELPIWLEAKMKNFNPANIGNVKIYSTQDGTVVPSTVFVAQTYVTSNNDAAFKITNMPAGEQTITVEVTNGATSETQSVKVNYIPAPFIQLNNIYDGKVFVDNEPYGSTTSPHNPKMFSNIQGRLVNFNTTAGSPDLDSVTVKINGVTDRLVDHLDGTVAANGNFTYLPPSNMLLVPGPNTVVISGTANGVPVSTTLTLYKFSDQVPIISSIKPVPFDPMVPQVDDPFLKFKQNGPLSYVTNDKATDVLFTVQNVDKVIINVDGVKKTMAQQDATGTLVPDDPLLLKVDSYDATTRTYNFRLFNQALPQTGMRSITIQATLASSSVAQTLQITRELSPYIILSPKLPNERVINQNYLDVSIQAEGADQVLIGKNPAAKGEQDIFRYQLNNLKVGVNTINFTVVRGTQKLNGSIDVNYAGTSTTGAQFKTQMPKSGSLKVFNGDLNVTFPKGTMLRKANTMPGQDSPSVDLFDSQNLLFGIADRNDGRTMKRYNRVGEIEGGLPRDGELKDVSPEDIAASLLNVPSHYGYTSPLYWIDAGYFDSSSLTQYRTVQGQQPYANGNQFYLRGVDKWMEPSQRGSISIKYDPYIRDVIAKKLSVWRFTGNSWTPLGGTVDTSKKVVTAPFDGFGYYAVFEDTYSFDDIIGHPYARNSLETIFAKGIMDAKNNNEFGVYDNITRGEFATMLVKILDIPLSYDQNNPTFQDVLPVVEKPALNGDYRYIETAVKRGIIRGLGPRIFAPAGSLTREQAAIMIARAMNLVKNPNHDKDLTSLQKLFTDANIVDYYGVSEALAVNKAGIIQGRPNEMLPGQKKMTYRFDPRSFLSRAEAAVIAERVMKQLKKL